jgi:lysophospholipase L1-like esterase
MKLFRTKNLFFLPILLLCLTGHSQGFFGSLSSPGLSLSTLAGKTISIRGNSITNSIGADSPTSGYAHVLVEAIGGVKDIVGVNGMSLEQGTSCGRLSYDVSSTPYKTSAHGLLIFSFSTNDVILNNGTFSVAGFKARYDAVLADAFSKGWLSNQIIILGPHYMNSTGAASLVGFCGCSAADLTRQLDYRDAALAVAKKYHTYFFDARSVIAGMSIPDNYLYDGLHPNQLGHTAIGNAMFAYLFFLQ